MNLKNACESRVRTPVQQLHFPFEWPHTGVVTDVYFVVNLFLVPGHILG